MLPGSSAGFGLDIVPQTLTEMAIVCIVALNVPNLQDNRKMVSDIQKSARRARDGIPSRAALAVRLVALAAILGLPAWMSMTNAEARPGKTRARLARTFSATDTGHLHLVHNGGEYITEEGQATGTVPGKVRAYLEVGPTVVAKFTIYTSVGTISGVGSGKPKGRSEEPSFAGTMTISRGTGRYKSAHGHGGFYGTLNRVTYKLVVQITGTLSY
jgi:hypothetical protein